MTGKTEHAGSAVFVLALLFMAFIGGGLVVVAKVPPSQFLQNAYSAATALFEQKTGYNNILRTNFWNPDRSEQRGVTIHDPQRAYAGYTLYTSADGAYARLIGMQGDTLYEWRAPYSKVWTPEAAIETPVPDDRVFMREARVFPNGDLLALYIAAGDSPYGYGIVKLDSESNVIWRYLEHAHHDVDIGPDGRIYILIHSYKTRPIKRVGFLEQPHVADAAVILSPDGEELKRIPLLPTMARSKYNELLTRGAAHHATRDPLHTNGIEVITKQGAGNFPFGEPGDLLISFRNISSVAVLDPESEKIIWATRGPWIEQHDADLLKNGDILMFDNYGHFEANNLARALQFDPETMKVTWTYHGTEKHPLSSKIRSSVQRLPNGNTLITESNAGRLIEVTREGDIVWEYINPVRGGDSDQFIPVISSGLRIDPAYFAPQFVNQLAGGKQ